jgi:hypothetical protein
MRASPPREDQVPIKSMTTTPAPGHMVHVCAACGAEHTIRFDRGGQKSKTGPFALELGDTLIVKVDVAPPATVTFAAGDFPDFGSVTAAQLATKLSASLSGVHTSDDAGGVLIESATTGVGSRMEIVGGAARAALGFPTDGRLDLCPSRPVLGVSSGTGPGQMKDKNVLALRRCNDCGSNECLIRTFDVAPPGHLGTFFHEHRKTVNALAEHCKASGWSHPDVAADHAKETAPPLDIDHEFPARPSVPPAFVRPSAPPRRGSA